ncbi:MAG: hypothetical protein U5L04_09875 [Trueperaceae bacterium]|nr:hypothetical protein [Trueperaceae bacterium]
MVTLFGSAGIASVLLVFIPLPTLRLIGAVLNLFGISDLLVLVFFVRSLWRILMLL